MLTKFPPLFIGLRYILAKKDNRFISFTSLISMAGLMLGVMALIIVLSVFNGSQGIMRDRALITVPHGDISSKLRFTDWQAVTEFLRQDPDITGISPYIKGEAMLSQQGYHQVTEVKGILPEAETSISTIENTMVEGSLFNLAPGQNGVVIGRALAMNLRLSSGDPVNLIVPIQQSASPTSLTMEMHRFTVVGIFDVRFNIGANLALIHIDDSLSVFGLEDASESVRLRLQVSDIHQASAVVARNLQALQQTYPDAEISGQDWRMTEASLFNALRMEKILTWFILMMIVVIGAFNIVSTLIMVVADKQADIAILRTMGAGKVTIMTIFMVQGSLVGIAGTAIGASLGLLIANNFYEWSSALESILSPQSLYMISSLPSRIETSDVVITCSSALIISFLATIYPAWKASRILPAEVLRYE